VPSGWYYLGPLAVSDNKPNQEGMIVRATAEGTLADVVDWERIGPKNTGPQSSFSAWRGIGPDGYVVMGDFFTEGDEKPTSEQTVGIKAVREDLVRSIQVQRLIWEGRQQESVLTLWDVVAVPLIFVFPQTFLASNEHDPEETKASVFLFNVLRHRDWWVIQVLGIMRLINLFQIFCNCQIGF